MGSIEQTVHTYASAAPQHNCRNNKCRYYQGCLRLDDRSMPEHERGYFMVRLQLQRTLRTFLAVVCGPVADKHHRVVQVILYAIDHVPFQIETNHIARCSRVVFSCDPVLSLSSRPRMYTSQMNTCVGDIHVHAGGSRSFTLPHPRMRTRQMRGCTRCTRVCLRIKAH